IKRNLNMFPSRRMSELRSTVDFTGSTNQRPDNFNAPEPVTRAAVLYVFRVMVEDNIPMNAGCLEPIDIVIPEGSMPRPCYPAARSEEHTSELQSREKVV